MKLPILLLIIVVFSLFFDSYIPISVKSFLYALSLSVKEIILFIVPLLIFFFIFNSVVKLQSNAIKLLALIVAMVCISNFFSTWLAYASAAIFNNILVNVSLYKNGTDVEVLVPFWNFSLPHLLNNEVSIVFALVLGSLVVFFVPKATKIINKKVAYCTDLFLHKVLKPLIPVFVIGFVIKLAHDQILFALVKNYLCILLIMFGSSVSYVLVWHILILGFTRLSGCLKNLMAPIVVGFSTMSSVVAMPVLILALEKNIKEKKLLNAIVPSVTNFHLVGDCFAIPILALSIMNTFGAAPLDIYQYLVFSIYFVIAKFAVVAVPGGGILVMLPLLKSILGFSDVMLSLITTLYIMFDTIITSINIFGNSFFSMLIAKIYDKILKKRK